MSKSKHIQVRAASSQEDSDSGWDLIFDFDTMRDAKAKAKYYLSLEYMDVCESTMRLTYSQVVVNDEVMYDYFVCQDGKVR